jgi:hypothetical protein
VITLRPIWPGLLIDSLLFGTLAGLIFTSLAWPRRLIRETSRMRNGFCLKCGYDLRFDFVAGCPECGWRRSS